MEVIRARREAHAGTGFADAFDANFTVTSIQTLAVHGHEEVSLEFCQFLDSMVPVATWGNWHGGYETVEGK